MEVRINHNQILEILRRLKEHYPEARCTLNHQNAFQLLIATILSAQCTDVRVNKVTSNFFHHFPDPYSITQAPHAKIESLIRSTGFYHQKAINIKQTCELLVNQFEGEVPATMEALIKMPGIGRKTANVILGTVYAKQEGIVVDTHVKRISNRLGFTVHLNPDKIEQDLINLIPQNQWIIFSHWIIEHGRKICKARNPDCRNCFLNDLCPSRMV